MIALRPLIRIGAAVAAAQLAGPAQAQQKVTFVVVNNLFSTPAYVATENGYWAKHGFDVAVSERVREFGAFGALNRIRLRNVSADNLNRLAGIPWIARIE